MGLAPLSKVTIIAPRSDYQQVVRQLAQFEQFHPAGGREPRFDPAVQELAVRAVRLFADADEAVRELSIPLSPGALDIVFRGVKIPREDVEASDWEDLLTKAESQLSPLVDRVKADKAELQRYAKEENDARILRDALEIVSKFSVDIGSISKLQRVKTMLATAETASLGELKASLQDVVFISQPLSEKQSLVLLASASSESARVARAMKALDVKTLTLPNYLPQNPAEAYGRLEAAHAEASKRRAEVEARMVALREESQERLLAIRELAEIAKDTLDEVRMAGVMGRLATISGYIPSKLDKEFGESFGHWMVYSEPAKQGHAQDGEVPTLMANSGPFRQFETITREQGTPGGHELDPTPVISFVFPVFFGIMFGDLGHGIVLALFALLLRARGTPSMRRWGNILLAAGISASVVGVIVGEFFGFPLYETFHIPGNTLLEIVLRPPGGQATLAPLSGGMGVALEIAILIGIAHITTGLTIDVAQAAKGHEMVEVITEKVPALTMYVSGVGFGIAFIGAGFSFNVFKSTGPAPLVGVSNSLLGGVSLVVVVASMMALLLGKGVAVMAGKSHEGSAGSAISNGAIEVFERISSYMANTISYVRIAIMLLIHAALLFTLNRLLAMPLYISVPMVIVFNILIIIFEALIVYIQDLRLHIYEFFTKFYQGKGVPFKKLLPDRERVKIKWL